MKSQAATNGWKRKAAVIAAIASVPLSVMAYYDYDNFQITNFGSIGSNYYSYSTSSSGGYAGLLMVGFSNYAGPTVQSSMVVGDSCIIYDTNSIVVGRWNKDSGGDEQFVVGTGTYSEPKNALEVFKNGTIRVLPQGDIQMGIYATP